MTQLFELNLGTPSLISWPGSQNMDIDTCPLDQHLEGHSNQEVGVNLSSWKTCWFLPLMILVFKEMPQIAHADLRWLWGSSQNEAPIGYSKKLIKVITAVLFKYNLKVYDPYLQWKSFNWESCYELCLTLKWPMAYLSPGTIVSISIHWPRLLWITCLRLLPFRLMWSLKLLTYPACQKQCCGIEKFEKDSWPLINGLQNLSTCVRQRPWRAQLRSVLQCGLILALGALFMVVLIQCYMKQIVLIWLQLNGRI